MTQFNYYESDIKKAIPLGIVTLDQFIRGIKNPKMHIRKIFDQINLCEVNGDGAEKARLKQGLFSFTPCVLVNEKRAYKYITSFTGLLVLDFDHLTENYAREFKYFLFETYPFIVAAWLSASRCGVRCLVKIPKVSSVDEFKSYFKGLQYYEMNQYKGFDVAPQNCVLPLFLSYDPNLLYREDASLWNMTYSPLPNIPIRQHFKIDESESNAIKIIQHLIDKITDNGHPQLRKAAYSLGGYVGAGLVDMSTAVDYINGAIDHNNYLRQKAETYKKTAKTMINKGQQSPLYL